jgi:hypothetical protein
MYTYEWMMSSYIRVCVIELGTHPPTPIGHPPMAARQPHSRQASQSRSNANIIAMLNPNRHIFRKWTPQPFPVHGDVGLEVGSAIILKWPPDMVNVYGKKN